DYTVMGDTVNLASRLESLAKNGEIYVSPYTYNMSRGSFEFKALDPIEVKGKREPVPVYHVLRTKPKPESMRGIAGLNAPLVGRTQEYEQLKQRLDDHINGKGQVITLVNEAGFGKSRMSRELKQYIREKGVGIVEGACFAYSQSTGYYIVTEMLKNLFSIDADDLEEAIAEKVLEGVPQLLGEPPGQMSRRSREIVPFIGYLLSVNLGKEFQEKVVHLDPQELKNSTFMALKTLFEGMAEQRPTLLLFDDLHWADPTSLDFISFLMESTHKFPLLVLCIYRPEKDHRCWRLGAIARQICPDRFTEMIFKKLTLDETDRLVRALLNMQDIPESILKVIRERADGVPFYIEEVLRTLLENGTIRQVGDHWEFSDSLDGIEIPGNIHGIIAARIDRLDKDLKEVLQAASAIGVTFSYNILETVTGHRDNLDQLLDKLQNLELIHESKAFPEREYRFKNYFTQEATYNNLLLKSRRELHKTIAETIEAIHRPRLDEQVELLAFHYTRAEEWVKAFRFTVDTGWKAKSVYANEEALQALTSALDIYTSRELPVNLYVLKMYHGLGDVHDLMGNYAKAVEYYEEGAKLSQSRQEQANLFRKVGRTYEKRGDIQTAMTYYNQGFDLLKGEPETAELGLLYMNAGWVHNRKGEYEKAVEFNEKALEILEKTNDLAEVSRAHNNLAVIYEYKGAWKEALDHNQKSIEIMERIGDLKQLGWYYTSLGLLNWKIGNLKDAKTYHKQSLELMEKVRYPYGISAAYLNLGTVCVEDNDLDTALDYLQRSLALHLGLNIEGRLCKNYQSLADLFIRKGDLSKAEEYCQKAMEIATRARYRLDEALIYGLLGRMEAQRNGNADDYFRKSIEMFSQLKRDYERGKVLKEFGKWKLSQEEIEEGNRYLEESEKILEAIGL
ncbi:MAG: tetratricopeptide repeat protein, partial [Candidatus Tectomicrobia bacterium]|nr:tetratricopeptide repeat protein [Candidatus Tectomicrobia bacterium]